MRLQCTLNMRNSAAATHLSIVQLIHFTVSSHNRREPQKKFELNRTSHAN